ncbi:MAG: nuclear transport factor 2 family protein [Pseudomonadota bacterium]
MTTKENPSLPTATELRRLVVLYARAMDRNEPELLQHILTQDVVIRGPGFAIKGMANACAVPGTLRETYAGTRHLIHNQTLSVASGLVEAETYSTAHHVIKPVPATSEKNGSVLIWEIRYQDQFRCCGGTWLIHRRELIVDWTERRSIKLGVFEEGNA